MSKRRNRRQDRPPAWRTFLLVFGMCVLAGAATGGAAGLIAGALLKGRLFGLGEVAGRFGGAVVFYPVGVIAGLVLAKRPFHLPGSVWLGVIICLTGSALYLLLAWELRFLAAVTFISYAAVAPVLGAGGYVLGGMKANRRSRK